jgi:prevent-host-death family protein
MRQTIRQPVVTTSTPQWQLQTAKAQLSELVEAALRGEPQRITRRGKDAVMVVSEASFLALKQSARHDASDFVAHLLAMPRERVPTTAKITSRASQLRLRDIEL